MIFLAPMKCVNAYLEFWTLISLVVFNKLAVKCEENGESGVSLERGQQLWLWLAQR